MRLTTYTDMGLRALIYLAIQPEGQLSRIQDVTDIYNASHNHMVKVVSHLTQVGLVRGVRGKGGGICLNRPAESIKVGEAIRLLEKHLDVVDCYSRDCRIVGYCRLQGAFSEAMESFLTTLDKYTLADMVVDKDGLSQVLTIADVIPA